jgi:predicted permease
VRWKRRKDDIERELRSHLELEAEELQQGRSPDEARSAARRAFGSFALALEDTREIWAWTSLERLRQDLHFALRMLRKNPGFTLLAVLSLALGIGATTAVFSVFDAAILRPMPVPRPERLVLLRPERQGKQFVLFNPLFEGLRRGQRQLAGMFAVSDEPYLKVSFGEDAAPAYVQGSLVSGGYFSVLGLSPALGRLLQEDDDRLPAESGNTGCSAVLSYSFWKRRFNEDVTVLGRGVRVREKSCTIVGVAPADFQSHQPGYRPNVWLPLRPLTDPQLLANRSLAFFSGTMGRLRDEATAAEAEAELTALYQQLMTASPQAVEPGKAPLPVSAYRMRLLPGASGLDAVRRQFGRALALLLGVVVAVLLIASANIANLLLARGAARHFEFATRAALGAGRSRLIRQLVTEGSLLAVLGGVAGVGLALVATPKLASLVSLRWMTVVLDAAPDLRVLCVALVATTLAALLSGVVPAVRLTTRTLLQGMASAGRSAGSRSGRRLTRALVAGQLALSLLLVMTASLLFQSIVRISSVDPGFQPEHVVLLDVRHESSGHLFGDVNDDQQRTKLAGFYRVLDERLNSLPGVRAASFSWLGLFGGSDLYLRLIDQQRPEVRHDAHVDYVSSRYFETVGMRMLRGRGFLDSDREGAERVAVVNEALLREHLEGEEALGRKFALEYHGEEARPFTVVGIVRNSRYNDLREATVQPMMWVPLAQAPFEIKSIALRVAPGIESAVEQEARTALRVSDPNLMVRKVTTLSNQVDETYARERLLVGLASAFGALALLLAAVGLYGTLAYAVASRVREIGIRLAIGAPRAAVLRSVLSDALRLAGWGLLAGIPLALSAGYGLRAFLFGVAPFDVVTLAGASVVLAVVAAAAAFGPARRASRVDPMVALKYE